jgi:hypothetical protein
MSEMGKYDTPDEDMSISDVAHREAVRAFQNAVGKVMFSHIKDMVGAHCLNRAIALTVKAHDATYYKAIKSGLTKPVPAG